jgi:tetraacyldisaccharide 4'-kinase
VLVAVRRLLYRTGCLKTATVPVPVVVVGNLIAGGAGKTPTVMAVVATLRSHGFQPGVISRGHGRGGDEVLDVTAATSVQASGDEPMLMRLRLGVPVVVGKDRVAAAHELLRLHPQVDVIVSDDGLQHLQLPRAVQVFVFDERGAGNGYLLPAGPLREPLPDRLPPRTLVLYNAPSPSTRFAGSVARRSLSGAVSLADWWTGNAPTMERLRELAGRPVIAAAGMAHPTRFFDMLESLGLTIERRPLPDHHDFASLPWSADTSDVIVTEKDAVKIAPARIGSTRVWVAPLDFRFDGDFERDLLALLPQRHARPPDWNTHGHSTA